MPGTCLITVCCISVLIAATGCADYEIGPCRGEGLTSCSSECVDLENDDRHCGLCGNACAESSYCAYGKCRCMLGYTDCSGICTNLNWDTENCGDCGNACSQDESCTYGGCIGGCEPWIKCGDGDCVDPMIDNDHCGVCNNPCDTERGFTCQNGTCSCSEGYTPCLDGDGVTRCVDLMSEDCHCGVCGNMCGCINGYCEYEDCGGDPSFVICGPKEPCISGESRYAGCVNISINPYHCGACFNECDVDSGFVCHEGQCEYPPCINEIQMLSDEIYAEEQGCTAVVRINHETKEIIGYHLECGPYCGGSEPCGSAELCECTEMGCPRVINYPSIDDEYIYLLEGEEFCGCVAGVSRRTGLLDFMATESGEMGCRQDFLYPTYWRPATDLGADCRSNVSIPRIAGYIGNSGEELSVVEILDALEIVANTAIPDAFESGGQVRSIIVVFYSHQGCLNCPNEWIVLIVGGS